MPPSNSQIFASKDPCEKFTLEELQKVEQKLRQEIKQEKQLSKPGDPGASLGSFGLSDWTVGLHAETLKRLESELRKLLAIIEKCKKTNPATLTNQTQPSKNTPATLEDIFSP